MTGPAPLLWHTGRGPAAAALDRLPGDAVVLATTPSTVTVAVRVGGRLLAPGPVPWVLPDRCYQLTAFTPDIELRWLADGDGGRAVHLSEDAALLPGPPTGSVRASAHLEQRAMLWGRATGRTDGVFSEWAESRIGTAHYPCPPGAPPPGSAQDPADRAVLRSVEYVTTDPRHGTAAVAATRLVALDLTRAGELR